MPRNRPFFAKCIKACCLLIAKDCTLVPGKIYLIWKSNVDETYSIFTEKNGIEWWNSDHFERLQFRSS